MRIIYASLVAMIVVISLLSCTEDENKPAEPDPTDSVDVELSDEDAAFLESLPETFVPLEDIFFDNGQNAKDFLDENDPDFLNTFSSGRIGRTQAMTPHGQKLLFLSRMFAVGNNLVDDSKHTHPAAGADSPAQNGLAYSWGSKDYKKRQIPPTVSGCMDKKIYGLDCSGMLWAMTSEAGITVEPKHNFFVERISVASKWTKAFKASADYKDLTMKDMGQIPQSKMKNGDVVVWGRHVGVYVQGNFYQSNGTSKAPGCKDNLSPKRGPRVISMGEVLSWGLGKYKVLRIEIELNFHLTVEIIENEPCGYFGQRSEDKVEMNINIKNEDVSISDIKNYNHTIHPANLDLVGDCSLTCIPAGTGPLNVTSADGEVYVDEFTQVFDLRLNHTDCKTPSITLKCPEIDPIESPPQTYETYDLYTFVLKDSLQTQNSPGEFGIFVRLEPK